LLNEAAQIGFVQLLLGVLVFFLYAGIALRTFSRYKKNQFEDNRIYLEHRRFWLTIALQPAVLMAMGLHVLGYKGLLYFEPRAFDAYYWHVAVLWALPLLTTTFGPAIRQNPQEIGLDGLLLVLADCCAVIYLLLCLVLPEVATNKLFVVSAVLALSSFAVVRTVIGKAQLKVIAKTILFEFSCWLSFLIAPLTFVWAVLKWQGG
jgi:hypothetical protein